MINIVVSVVLGSLTGGDQCGLYYTAVVIDVTIGTSVCYGLLYSFDRLVSYQNSKVGLADPETQERQLFQESRERRWVQEVRHRLLVLVPANRDLVLHCIYGACILLQMKFIVTGLQLIFSGWIIEWGNFSMSL